MSKVGFEFKTLIKLEGTHAILAKYS